MTKPSWVTIAHEALSFEHKARPVHDPAANRRKGNGMPSSGSGADDGPGYRAGHCPVRIRPAASRHEQQHALESGDDRRGLDGNEYLGIDVPLGRRGARSSPTLSDIRSIAAMHLPLSCGFPILNLPDCHSRLQIGRVTLAAPVPRRRWFIHARLVAQPLILFVKRDGRPHMVKVACRGSVPNGWKTTAAGF